MRVFWITTLLCLSILITHGKTQAQGLGGLFGSKIHSAAKKGDLNAVKKLVEKKNSNVDLQNKNGETALHVAAANGNLEVMGYLLEQGALIDIQDAGGNTALHQAALAGFLDGIELLTTANSKIADVDHANYAGNTALHIAAWKGHLDVVQFFLKLGAQIDYQDKHGQTALQLASTWNHPEIVEDLIKRDANLDLTNHENRSALTRAVINGNGVIVTSLLNAGANHLLVDKEGKLAFEFALNLSDDVKSKVEIIELLESNMNSADAQIAKEKQSKINEQRRIEAKRLANPYFCEEKNNPELSENDNKAIRYLIRKEFSSSGLGTKDRLCIEYIRLKDSVVIRGEKVVTYTAGLMFPKGHKTHCLDKRSTSGANWSRNMDCALNVGIKPQAPGARGNWDGESTI